VLIGGFVGRISCGCLSLSRALPRRWLMQAARWLQRRLRMWVHGNLHLICPVNGDNDVGVPSVASRRPDAHPLRSLAEAAAAVGRQFVTNPQHTATYGQLGVARIFGPRSPREQPLSYVALAVVRVHPLRGGLKFFFEAILRHASRGMSDMRPLCGTCQFVAETF
jgi:hypothetical protein